MTVLTILAFPEALIHSPDLGVRKPSRELRTAELSETWFKELVLSMFETLYAHPSGIGLAAPQVGINLQLAVLDVKRNGKNPIVLINPFYRGNGEETIISTEACLSAPGFVGEVKRHKQVEVTTLELKGTKRLICAEDFLACALQHEIDHLQGILYLDRLIEPDSLKRQATKAKRMTAIAAEAIGYDDPGQRF